MGLKSLLVNASDVIFSKAGRNILSGLGIGLVTSTISLTLLNRYIEHATSQYTALGAVVGLLGLAGFNVALSIIFSSLVIRMTMNINKISFRAK